MIDLRLPKPEAWQASEESLHKKCMEFTKKSLLKRNYPQIAHHCPSGGNRSQREGANFKLLGVIPGVPDIFVPIRKGDYSGLYVELKDAKGKPSQFQIDYMKAVTEQGFLCLLINCLEVYKENLTQYLDQ